MPKSREELNSIASGVQRAFEQYIPDTDWLYDAIYQGVKDAVTEVIKAELNAAPDIAETAPDQRFPRHIMRAIQFGTEDAMRK